MAFPRPTIVERYEDCGTTIDRHGKKVKLQAPVYSTSFKGFRHYLVPPKKNGGRFKFPRGTFQKIISEHCRPCEGIFDNGSVEFPLPHLDLSFLLFLLLH